LQWVISAYSITFGCFLLLWGRIADIFGKRLIFVLGSAFVAVTMVINPFLKNEIAFDLFRGLQGIVSFPARLISSWALANTDRAARPTFLPLLEFLV
jgi:MFS family permease